MRKYVIFLLIIIGCKSENKKKPAIESVIEKEVVIEDNAQKKEVYHFVQSSNPEDFEKVDVDIDYFKNKIFSIGPSIEKNRCELVAECDCCTSDLVTFENEFILANYCLGGDDYLKGKFEIDDGRLILIFNQEYVLHEIPYDPIDEDNVEEIKIENLEELLISQIDFHRCNEQFFLVMRYDEANEFGFEDSMSNINYIKDFKLSNPKIWEELKKI